MFPFSQAYNCYLDALGIQPTFAIAWSNLAGLFMEAGDLNRALQYYKVRTTSLVLLDLIFFLDSLCICMHMFSFVLDMVGLVAFSYVLFSLFFMVHPGSR